MSLLSGTVLLTGATGGIGHAIARALGQHGARMILSSRRTELLDPLASELGARVIAADLARREDIERLVEQAGQVDVLVANAGVPAAGHLIELSQEQIDRMLDINLRAAIALARGLAPGMVERGRGHLVFMSSLQGKTATPVTSIYCATKFGLRGFALALREDLRRHGVGVSVVLPGFVRDAGMFADSGTTLPPGVGTRSPEEVAQAVITVIERNRAELDVAPLHIRLGATLSGAMPGIASAVSRRLGSERIAADIVAGQREKR